MKRKQISVQPEINVYSKLQTNLSFNCGNWGYVSLYSAVHAAIQRGDCTNDTQVILDGKPIGTLWGIGFDVKTLVFREQI